MKSYPSHEFAAILRKKKDPYFSYLCGELETNVSGRIFADDNDPAENFIAIMADFFDENTENVFVNTNDENLLENLRSVTKTINVLVPSRFKNAIKFISESLSAEKSDDDFDFLGIARENCGVFAYEKKKSPETKLPLGISIAPNTYFGGLQSEEWDILPMLEGSGAKFMFLSENDDLAAWLAYGAKDVNALGVIHIYTHPRFRKKGYATILAKAFAEKAVESDCLPLYGAAVNEASKKTALAAGFSPVGERVDYFKLNK